MPSLNKFSYIETFGCQMNDRDSEIMTQLMSESYRPTLDLAEADVVVVNTCSIRQKAEEKAFSLLGRLKLLKSKKPSLRIAVTGCVAQQEGKNIITRMPFVDMVIGPQNLYNLPEYIEQTTIGNKKIVAVEQIDTYEIKPYLPTLSNGPPHKRFVTIMQGCNNYCTYCVVPFTRGREVSREFSEIIDEVKHLVDYGVQEITLLGQNVNSYGRDNKEKDSHNFSELLKTVSEVNGLKRLRFTTSNPRDLTKELTRCFADIENLCSHFHLPVQSGSNNILKRMNRKYTIDTYLNQVEMLRKYRPDISITTDIIVGFPGETDEDFIATMDLVETVRYHGAFSFKYSDRPQAKSVEFDGKLPEDLKSERLAVLQKRVDEIVRDRNKEFIGNTETIMIEGTGKLSENRWHGRTSSNHIVHFNSETSYTPGQLVDLKINQAFDHSLQGKLVG